jgi:hypothetical protein
VLVGLNVFFSLFNKKVSKNSLKNFFTFSGIGKKASSQMWWIIIGAVIALVVMIILMVMFTDKSGAVSEGLLECTSKGGSCWLKSDQVNCPGTWSDVFECTGEPEKGCCLGVPKGQKTDTNN